MPEEVAREFLMPDGRVLHGLLHGSDTDDLVLFCHGTPFPSVPYDLFFNESEARGLGFLTWARPGYGESTPQPGRSVRSFADDAHVSLDAVGAKRVIHEIGLADMSRTGLFINCEDGLLIPW